MRVWTGRFCIVRTVNSYSLVNIPVQQISAALCVLNQYLCSSDRSSGEEGSAVVRKKKAAVTNPMIQKVCLLTYSKSALFVFYEAVVDTEAITTSYILHIDKESGEGRSLIERKWREERRQECHCLLQVDSVSGESYLYDSYMTVTNLTWRM